MIINIKVNKNVVNQHFKDIQPIINERIEKILNKGGIKKKKRGRIKLNSDLRSFLELYLKCERVQEIIISRPPKLLTDFAQGSSKWYKIGIKNSDDYLITYNIFVQHAYSNLDNLKFIDNIGIKTCPYCNRSYIHTLNESKKVKPELDHFFPKEKYPLLAVSFYNLIPSCQTCNGYACKHSYDPLSKVNYRLKSPYEITDADLTFTYKLKNSPSRFGLTKGINIDFAQNKITENTDLFKINELYQHHVDHVEDLIVKSRLYYSNKYREYLKSYRGLVFSNKDIDRLILGNYSDIEDLNQRPLSKLYRDIGMELGLI